ncbi:MAG: urea ABC transporter permease subunit UrtB [Fuerstiella sp.]|nr:urea ABC transporter permease subunit UrtB [Fuerstiella sp.]
MDASGLLFSGRVLTVLALVFCSAPACGWVLPDDTTRETLALLASSDEESRQQALATLAASREPRMLPFLEHYSQGAVFLWNTQVVVCTDLNQSPAPILDPVTLDPLKIDGAPVRVDVSELRDVAPSGRSERRAVADVIRQLEVWMPDLDKRLAAIQRFGDSRDPKFLDSLNELMNSDAPEKVIRKARENALLIRISGNIQDQTADERLIAINEIGDLCVARAVPVLNDILNNEKESQIHVACRGALATIENYQKKVRLLQNIFNGLSLGSILILMALGLSIIFGQMGVINMAHGELMMVGAYATYEMQLLFGHTPETPTNLYYIVAFPVSFLAAAVVGFLMERLVVRHLYGRPLDSLLATWGISLVLIQCVRVKYGDNIGVNSPSMLVGSFEVLQDLVIPRNRAFILVLCGFCVLSVHALFRYTRAGLLIRATVQGRETASGHGVNTRLIDGLTFAVGSGLAGIAGFAWTTVGGVTPDMGQNHIVDSFLVVVTGGVGKLAGAVFAGLGIGSLNKILEPLNFGEGLMTMGLVIVITSWALGVAGSFRIDRKLGMMSLIPGSGPITPVFSPSVTPGIRTAATFYCIGCVSIFLSWSGGHLVEWFGHGSFVTAVDAMLTEPIRAIWAKVLILSCVVLFIQWRPLGLFPPRGRLADA